MYDIEHIRAVIIRRAADYYAAYQHANAERSFATATEALHKHQAVADLARTLFDASDDELQGRRPSAFEEYGHK